MRLNNKGFMMAEVVVVSAVVLVTLTSLYISYNKIYSLYSTRLTYTDVSTLYKLAYYRDCLLENNKLSSAKNASESNPVNITSRTTYLSNDNKICDGCKENIFLINNNGENINKNVLDSFTINQTYKDYINYLSTAVDLTDSYYIMVMEKCNTSNENCKYSYMVVN